MNDRLRIGIIGATGRLGSAIGHLALCDPRFQIAAALTHSKSPHLHLDYGSFLKLHPIEVPIATTAASLDLLIDVSLAAALPQNLSLALSLKKPLVVGTTGISDLAPLRKASKTIPLFYASNFSLGMALLQRCAHIARNLDAQIDLIETHHAQKKDTPSGSALSLAAALDIPSSRIHSIRSGNIVGKHQLLFITSEEQLTFTHEVFSRDTFARGALAAAHFLAAQPPGLYDMEDLLA